ncbi:hypothetical protein GIB67_025673 [Kingdonia uniflora]|uniref:Protein kinase domain-containing protein n=1 Tax=Kingdonia uniflora TaxID=39325 RepID=A0A7J7L8R2_9MAGN|nr:hypothetical protein GIB67_025673 [Kingdonia uniflora]
MFSRWCRGVRFKKEAAKSIEEIFITANGGKLLELLKSIGYKYEPYRVFSKKELEMATKFYDQHRIFYEDASYILYRGFYDGRNISVKKFKENNYMGVDNFTGSVVDFVISLHIRNHKNVMKLLGCCLEIKIPILVYEYSSNKNLYDILHKENDIQGHLFSKNLHSALSRESKLRIATEIADAVTYMHTTTSTPFIRT